VVPIGADDAGDIAVEAFTALMIFKNMFSFALTWVAYNWILLEGTQKVFLTIGAIQVAVCFLSVPMCKRVRAWRRKPANVLVTDIFGKKNRAFFSRHNLLEKTGLW
jgi:hypothetical protein